MIYGPKYDDVLLAKAASKVIISAEKIVAEEVFRKGTLKADIPHFMVTGVVHAPSGAKPCSCHEFYDIDRAAILDFKGLKDPKELEDYLAQYTRDHLR